MNKVRANFSIDKKFVDKLNSAVKRIEEIKEKIDITKINLENLEFKVLSSSNASQLVNSILDYTMPQIEKFLDKAEEL